MLNLWGQQVTGYRCVVEITEGVAKQRFFDDDASAMDYVFNRKTDGALYYSPFLFDKKSRTQAAAGSVRAFWLDIDCGEGKDYPSIEEATTALVEFTAKVGLPTPTTVFTGGGLHVYWRLTRHIHASEWTPIAQRFKQACNVHGFKADPSRTADSASLLRIPGTVNVKYEHRPVVQVLNEAPDITLDAFKACLPSFTPTVVSGGLDAGEFDIPVDFPPAHLDRVVEKCAQMRDAVAKSISGEYVAEPVWRAMLSVVLRCEGGDVLIHEISKNDPRYNKEETESKAKRTGAPATCHTFACHNSAACLACPSRGCVKSPIVLGAKIEAETPEEKAADSDLFLNEIGNFSITTRGVRLARTGEPIVTVTSCPVWVVAVREQAESGRGNGSYVTLVWTALDGSSKRESLPQRDMYDARLFIAWLADHNLVSQINSQKDFLMYIKEATRELIRRNAVGRIYTQMGWYKDGFLIGKEMITADGATPASVQISQAIKDLDRRGTAQAWADAVAVFGKPDLWPHAFTLLAGFGSPLLHLVGKTSAVLSLVGESSRGKTLSASAALSIYGDPRKLMQSAIATANAVELQLSAHRHVPHLLDEVSSLPPYRLAEYLYTAANGKGKDSLTRSRQTREGGEWALVPIITSNRPLSEYKKGDIQEAHRRRLVELHMRTSIDPQDAARVFYGIDNNFGAVRELYLRAVASIRQEIPSLFHAAETEIQRGSGLPSANRFGLWLLSAALVGGRIAQSINLIQFDPTVIVMEAARDVCRSAGETELDADRVHEALSDYIVSVERDVALWDEGGLLVNNPVSPKARVDRTGKKLYIGKRVLFDMLLEEGISRGNIADWLKANAEEIKNGRLTPTSPRIVCYAFPLNLFNME